MKTSELDTKYIVPQGHDILKMFYGGGQSLWLPPSTIQYSSINLNFYDFNKARVLRVSEMQLSDLVGLLI